MTTEPTEPTPPHRPSVSLHRVYMVKYRTEAEWEAAGRPDGAWIALVWKDGPNVWRTDKSDERFVTRREAVDSLWALHTPSPD
jgi:hypothetical protein